MGQKYRSLLAPRVARPNDQSNVFGRKTCMTVRLAKTDTLWYSRVYSMPTGTLGTATAMMNHMSEIDLRRHT